MNQKLDKILAEMEKKGQNEQQWHHNKRSALVIHTVGYLGNAQIKCDWQPYML